MAGPPARRLVVRPARDLSQARPSCQSIDKRPLRTILGILCAWFTYRSRAVFPGEWHFAEPGNRERIDVDPQFDGSAVCTIHCSSWDFSKCNVDQLDDAWSPARNANSRFGDNERVFIFTDQSIYQIDGILQTAVGRSSCNLTSPQNRTGPHQAPDPPDEGWRDVRPRWPGRPASRHPRVASHPRLVGADARVEFQAREPQMRMRG